VGGLLTGFAGDVGDSMAGFLVPIPLGWGLEELWWRERLPLQDVTDARPGACLRGGGDWADGADDDIDDYDAHGARLDGGVLSEAGA
jgi:hypothetical protein